MPLGPVFRHEMIAAGRKRRYFALAALVGLGMLCLLAIGYQFVEQQQQIQQMIAGEEVVESTGLSISGAAQLTGTFYKQFAWATMIGVLMITPVISAGAIASERERRTIEYLFATDLSNSEIVLDKLAARLLTVAKLVVATLPVLAIFRLLGGVPGWLLLTHFAMLASTATLAAAIAMTVGVWCERARDAVPRAFGTLFFSLLAAPAAMAISLQLSVSSRPWLIALGDWVVVPLTSCLTAIHPLWILATSAGVGAGVLGVDVNSRAIAIMVGGQLLLAAVLLAVSVRVVRRVHLDAVSAPGAVRKGGRAVTQTRSPYDKSPMVWKEMFAAKTAKSRRQRVLRSIGLALLVLSVFGPLSLVIYFQGGSGRIAREYAQMVMMYVGACGPLLVLLMGSRAASLISQERERDTWLSLLTSDLSAKDILRAKTVGNFYAHRWMLLGLTLIPLSGVILMPTMVFSALGVLGVALLCGWAATAIGLAYSLRLSTSTKALTATVFTLLGIGLFYTFLIGGFFAFAGVGGKAIEILAVPPLVPMLFTMPFWLLEYVKAEMLVPFVLGCLFYAFLGFTVGVSNESMFDRVCERGIGQWGSQPPTPTAGRYSDAGPTPPVEPGPTGA